MLLRQPGIYEILCVPNRKRYIGSAVDAYRRWHAHHLSDLRAGRHCNRYLQRAWDKYGEAAFKVRVVEYVASDQLVAREQYWLDRYRSYDRRRGFNLLAVARSSAGYKHTLESLQQMGATHAKNWIVRDAAGHEQQVFNLSRFCREHGLTVAGMNRVARGLVNQHKGWECRYPWQSREEWLATVRVERLPAVVVGTTKRCSECKTYQPFANFTADRQTRSGLSAYCRTCTQIKSQLAYLLDREQQLAKSAVYRAGHRDKLRKQANHYYSRNAAAICEKQRQARRLAKEGN